MSFFFSSSSLRNIRRLPKKKIEKKKLNQIKNQKTKKQLEAIYHTAVLLRGEEIYFGAGISRVPDGRSRFGSARLRVLDLGATTKTADDVEGFLRRASASTFSATSYDLLRRNCNHFSDEFATFLTGSGIPREIVTLPEEVMNSPFGAAMRPMLSGLEASLAVNEGGVSSAAVGVAPAPAAAAATTAALEAAAGRAAVADARERERRHEAPATASLASLADQERAVAADVAAAAAAAAEKKKEEEKEGKLKAEFEALVRAEFDAVRSSRPALSANEAAAEALERAARAVRGRA